MPREDVLGRYLTARAMIQAIEAYMPTDRHPRQLFLLEGRLAMDMVWAAHDALVLPTAERRRVLEAAGVAPTTAQANPDAALWNLISYDLSAARVAFQNAVAADTVAPLIEPISDIEPLILLGDALFAAGDISGARDAYARAVDAFIDDDEPEDQIIGLSRAVARWASLRIVGGACRPDAAQDRAWEDRWSRLGTGSHEVCAFGQSEAITDQPSLLAVIRPLVADAIESCAPAPRASPWVPALDERVAMIDCQRRSGPDDLEVVRHFVRNQSGEAVNAQIGHALGIRP